MHIALTLQLMAMIRQIKKKQQWQHEYKITGRRLNLCIVIGLKLMVKNEIKPVATVAHFARIGSTPADS